MYNNYKLIREETMKALNGQGILLEHEKTGARVFVISNDDDNKVFNITFRTPPADDTGLPHILEHSVLCGSRKYPLKDPFVELAKGSLNTFLNAMTYPDKTMYPVASCNSKDFRNLTDVYLDAVFYPNIYQEPRILKQEGWHYEMEDVEGDIIYNGVVYNEMKGASSSPEQVLFRQIQNVLFPDHPYGFDSGGEPSAIPSLTEEAFLDFHRRYYHPSNSFIYFYGDMDVAEQLQWLDEAYLSAFDKITIDSSLKILPAFDAPVHVTRPYAVSEGTSTDKKTYLSYNVAFNPPEEAWEVLGLEILSYLLLEAPGAPLKEALLSLGIAEDIFGSYDSALSQPTMSIVAKNANPEDEALFLQTIKKVLGEVADKGVDGRKVAAAINNFEFKTREADFGQYPKGIIYAIKALDTWLYDRDPFAGFDYDKAFSELRAKAAEGHLATLVRRYLLDNTHCGILQLVPEDSLLAKKEAEAKAALAAYKATLTEEEKAALVAETKALKIFQETPNTADELATIPLLAIDDIDKEGASVTYDKAEEDGVTYILHKTFTNNIVYGRLLFDFSHLSFEEVPYVSLLAKVLTKIDTENYSYSTLNDDINIHTGGIRSAANVYGVSGNPDECQTRLEIKFKCFGDKVTETLALIEEVVKRTLFKDAKRLGDILNENRSRLTMSLMSAGHTAALTRAMSYHSITAKYRDLLDGIDFYRFLEDAEAESVLARLEKVAGKVLTKNNLTVAINGDAVKVPEVQQQVAALAGSFEGPAVDGAEEPITFNTLNEGFKTSSKVQYNALTGDFIREGYAYSGHMRVLQTIMSLDYMWKEVRVKGGAYGGFSGFRRGGTFFLGSYRDPNLKKTYDIYRQLPDYIRKLALDEREMTKYIIGTISGMDTPMTPSMKGDRALSMYMSGISQEDAQEERAQVLRTTVEDLKPLADLVAKVIDQNNLCVIGNETIVEAEKDILDTVMPLFK